MGSVLDLDTIVSNRQAKFVAIDKQANDDIVHLHGFGKANGLACQTLDARAQRQMLPFNLLGLAFTRGVDCGLQLTLISSPVICQESRDPKGFQQGFQLQKHVILTPAKDIRSHGTRPVINRMPEPALLLLLPHKAPHFINFRFVYPTDRDFHVAGVQPVQEERVDRFEHGPFFFNS
jgi:hypothetical protein